LAPRLRPRPTRLGPFGWYRDFADARQRLHDCVATSGTRFDGDRPTRQTIWSGEPSTDTVEDVMITDRDDDFVRFVAEDVARRRAAQVASNLELTADSSHVWCALPRSRPAQDGT
jgi:hypothetical protein